MQEFLTYIVKNIVKNPDDVSTEEVVEGNTYVYTISVNQDDMGLVIGKEGRIIKAIRSLAKSKAIKDGVMIRVELNEPDRVRPGQEPAVEQTEESSEDLA